MVAWSPAPPLEIFAEALSVPAMVHTPVRDTRVLVVGAYAVPLAKLALRYPSTLEVVAVADRAAPLPRHPRMRRVDRLEDLDETWQADVAAVAVPGDPQPTLAAISQHLRSDGLMVVALDQFNRGRDAREALLRHWAYVLPYREHAPEPVLFLLASNRRLGRPLRPIPPKLTRINTRYLPAMFLLGSDEARLLYGEAV